MPRTAAIQAEGGPTAGFAFGVATVTVIAQPGFGAQIRTSIYVFVVSGARNLEIEVVDVYWWKCHR